MILVIFDIDGTLVYSERRDSRCFAAAYQEVYDRPFPSLDWQDFPHVTDHVIFNTALEKHFGRQATLAEIDHFQGVFVEKIKAERQVSPAEFRAVAQAPRMVERLLADDRFVLGVGTGGWLRPAEVKLQHVGIQHQALHMSAADNQPTRRHILQRAVDLAAAQHGDPERVVYVGDALWDVETTRQMGLNFIGIRRQGDFAKLENAGAGTVFQDFRDEESFVEALLTARPPKEV